MTDEVVREILGQETNVRRLQRCSEEKHTSGGDYTTEFTDGGVLWYRVSLCDEGTRQ